MKYKWILYGAPLFVLLGCSGKSRKELANYNDSIVHYVQQADKQMDSFQRTDIMENYANEKYRLQVILNGLEDSVSLVPANENDDTLRQTAVAVIHDYLMTFATLDMVRNILSDTIYMEDDSIKVARLLNAVQGTEQALSDSFAVVQQRFAFRHGLISDK